MVDDAAKAGVDAPDQVLWSPDSKNLAFLRVGHFLAPQTVEKRLEAWPDRVCGLIHYRL